MSEHATTRERPRGPGILLTLATYAAILAALYPLLRVLAPGPWLPGVLMMPALVLAVGYATRRLGWPSIAVTATELGVWVVVVTFLFLPDSSLLRLLPTPVSFDEVGEMLSLAMQEIITGFAPLPPEGPLTFLIVASVGLLTIVMDHVVLTARMPLLAAVGLIAVSLIPALAVPGDIDVAAFVVLAITLLLLLRADTRRREGEAGPAPARSASREPRVTGVTAAAMGIGAIAVVVTMVAAPMLPAPLPRTGAGFGPGANSIDPTLQLGEDLRRPEPNEVMYVRSDAAAVPYLRAATLSEFDGRIWRPDGGRPITLESESALAPVDVDENVRVIEYTTTVEVRNLVSRWLPVAYPAVSVDGLQGDWSALPFNRTVISSGLDTNGQRFSVTTHVPRPTLEQIRASRAGAFGVENASSELPERTPELVSELAAELTADAESDYDALLTLQSWFRGNEFEYSLDAPVRAGFDGTGAEALEQFLILRSGYCVHFASAFALMARSLDMPSRIVVGYLPGSATTEVVDGQTVHLVTSDQLHAWPEVHFEGIGWIAFEPTKSLGQPTRFSPAAVNVPTTGRDVVPSAAPTTSAAPAPSIAPEEDEEFIDSQLSPTDASAGGVPWALAAVGLVALLLLPALLGELRRRRLRDAARERDAAAAWRSVQDAAIDLGIPLPAGESPRSFARRLVDAHAAPPEAMELLVRGIEHVSYARGTGTEYGHGSEVADAVAAVRAALSRTASPGRRALALLFPRSLVIQPGSVFAVDAQGARTG